MPLGLKMEPSHSMTPTHFAPALHRYLMVWRPTLPKPWTMKVLSAQPGVTPIMFMYWASLIKLSIPWNTPRPVAEVRLWKKELIVVVLLLQGAAWYSGLHHCSMPKRPCLNTGQVRYSNGSIVSDCQTVWFSNGGLNCYFSYFWTNLGP